MAQPLLHTILHIFNHHESNAKMSKRKKQKQRPPMHFLKSHTQIFNMIAEKKSNLFIKDFNAQQRLGSLNNTGDRDSKKLMLYYEL